MRSLEQNAVGFQNRQMGNRPVVDGPHLGATTAGISARKPDSIRRQDATEDEGVEHACATSAVQTKQACRLWKRQIESGHLAEFRPHSCTEVMFDRRSRRYCTARERRMHSRLLSWIANSGRVSNDCAAA